MANPDRATPGPTRRRLWPAWALVALGVIVAGGRWLIDRRGEQQVDAVDHYNKGVAFGDEGKLAKAIAEYRSAILIDPDFPEAHYNLGIALAARGKRREAIAEFRKVIHLKPDYVKAHNELGIALAHQNLGKALRDQAKARK
jgi:tetratricopeptide (TPR) repeat protein